MIAWLATLPLPAFCTIRYTDEARDAKFLRILEIVRRR